MKKLTEAQFQAARDFMKTRPRKLERALFEYEFENGSAAAVLRELGAFQNADGGFGHGLEPDVRCPESSVLATTVAFQIILRLEERDKGMIKGAIRFLTDTYDPRIEGWRNLPKAADESPRAIWWNYSDDVGYWGNPGAEAAAYLRMFREYGADPSLTEKAHRTAFQHLQEKSDLSEMHEMYCYLRWAQSLTASEYEQAAPFLDRFVANCVIRDPSARQGYGAVPLHVAESPDSPYYSRFAEVIPGDLDALIAAQTEAGSWTPNWSWGRFESVWPTARTEWEGAITLDSLRKIRNFGRLTQG